ncbi:MAG TPA: pyridoxamine 5'-phosphate oxidase [Moheibacter sp.]|nr:pyridoxamine 5'-phosphate oxidase [Moheibacter sp.]
MKQDLSDKRKDYSQNFMDFTLLPNNPMDLFHNWYRIAMESNELDEPYAMNLSTLGPDGFPRNRIVLLREINPEGFIFYTNYESQKGKAIAQNQKVCISFFWDKLEQQIIIKGMAEKIDAQKSDDYFHKRPIESQIGAMLSAQSSEIGFDVDLESKVPQLLKEYEGKTVPRPENWGGYLIKPVEFEFWQGRPSRLHNRVRYVLKDKSWSKSRLAP